MGGWASITDETKWQQLLRPLLPMPLRKFNPINEILRRNFRIAASNVENTCFSQESSFVLNCCGFQYFLIIGYLLKCVRTLP